MNLILDSTSEQRIQREIDRGHYHEPSQVVAHALALLEEREAQDGIKQETANEAADSKAIDAVFGIWKDRHEDGLAYQQRMRDEW
jgi:Arc/MetJ-type ribon-helix-helix transcriptional regulator